MYTFGKMSDATKFDADGSQLRHKIFCVFFNSCPWVTYNLLLS